MTVLYSLQNNARAILHQALFILNFLNLPQGEILTRAEKHFEHKEVSSLDQPIWLKLAADMEWQPGILLQRGRGYGFVSTQDGRKYWLPAQWIQARTDTNSSILMQNKQS